MTVPEPAAPAFEPQRHLVDLQFDEVSHARPEVLKREMMRMREEGWTVQLMDDHLIASRRESGLSQVERTLILIAVFLVLAYAATTFLPDQIESLPFSSGVFVGGAALLGAMIAFLTRARAAQDRRLAVSIDGHGRPYVTDVSKRDF
jgi:hypothetical protein